MTETFTLRVAESLMDRVDCYARSKEMKRAEAFRSLVELGLKINDIREDDTPDIDDEFKKILIELCIRQNQQFMFSVKGMNKEDIQSNADQVKSKMKDRYPLIDEKYNTFLYPKK